MGAVGAGIGGLFAGLIITFAICAVIWYFVLKCPEKKEKECPQQMPLQNFLAKKCPDKFIKVGELRLPFKADQKLITNFDLVGKDALDSAWDWRKVNVCAGVLTDAIISTTVPDTRLYSFISKNNNAKVAFDINTSTFEVADVRLLYQASYATLPFTVLTDKTYSSTVILNGNEYKYVQARIAPVELSDYVLSDKTTTSTSKPILAIPIPKGADPTGPVISSTFYDVGYYNYDVRFGVQERTIENFYQLTPYTKTPIIIENVQQVPEGVDYYIYNTNIQFTR